MNFAMHFRYLRYTRSVSPTWRALGVAALFQMASLLALLLLGAAGMQAHATELVYAPINPSFGGNPNNAPGLMSIAQSQNAFRAPATTPVEAFNQSLQRAILSRLTSQTMTALFGNNTVLENGSYDTPGYTIKVEQIGNTITITTTDKNTGAVASFEMSTP